MTRTVCLHHFTV